jgi:hypothetical protein
VSATALARKMDECVSDALEILNLPIDVGDACHRFRLHGLRGRPRVHTQRQQLPYVGESEPQLLSAANESKAFQRVDAVRAVS